MSALFVTSHQWTAFTNLCSRVGEAIPMYSTATHPKTGELGYLVDKDDWNTLFISIGINPFKY